MDPTNPSVADDRLLAAPEAAQFVGLSLAQFWRSVGAGVFPSPFYPATRAPRWSLVELRGALEKTRARPGEPMARRRGLRTPEAA